MTRMKTRNTLLLTGLASLALSAAPLSLALAGAVSGAHDHSDTVKEGMRDVYHIVFTGGENARVEAKSADKSDDIDLYIYDSDNNLVTKDVLNDGDPICSWTPSDKAEYTIKIVNNEKHSVDYRLTTN